MGISGLTAGLFLLHFVTADTDLRIVMAFMAVAGFGLGNLMQPLTLAMQNALPPTDMGVFTAAATFSRQIGGTPGVAVFLSMLFTLLPTNITTSLETVRSDSTYQQAATDAVKGTDPVDKNVVLGLSKETTAPAIVD